MGYNYRLSEINCALGIVQLQRIDDILSKRARVAGWYQERLQEIPEIRVPSNQPNCRISWFVFVIRLAEEFPECHRNKIIDELTMMGIGCNKYFQPIHLQPFYVKMFGYQRGDFPMAEHAADHTIALPFFTHLEEDQVDYVCAVLKKILKKLVLKKY